MWRPTHPSKEECILCGYDAEHFWLKVFRNFWICQGDDEVSWTSKFPVRQGSTHGIDDSKYWRRGQLNRTELWELTSLLISPSWVSRITAMNTYLQYQLARSMALLTAHRKPVHWLLYTILQTKIYVASTSSRNKCSSEEDSTQQHLSFKHLLWHVTAWILSTLELWKIINLAAEPRLRNELFFKATPILCQ